MSNKEFLSKGKISSAELSHAICLIGVDEADFPESLKADEKVIVPPSVMQKISGVKTPEGLIAELKMPPNISLQGKRYILAIDGISDPGNLGTLLRTALALGWEGAYIVEGSCDPYNDKALRAAKGATFRLPLYQGSWDTLLQLPLPRYVANLEGKSINEFASKEGAILSAQQRIFRRFCQS